MRFFGVKKNALERLELYRDETERGKELSGALFSRALVVSLLFGAVFNEKISRFVNPFSRENASEKTALGLGIDETPNQMARRSGWRKLPQYNQRQTRWIVWTIRTRTMRITNGKQHLKMYLGEWSQDNGKGKQEIFWFR